MNTSAHPAGLMPSRQGLITGIVLLCVAGLAWWSVLLDARMMVAAASTPDAAMMGAGMPGMDARVSSWSLSEGAAYVIAWGVMMAAMMLPSATPMIALYGSLRRQRAARHSYGVPVLVFTGMYLLVWMGFGIPVYVTGVSIEALQQAFPVVFELLPYGIAVTLIAAGVYQFSSLKTSCLRACQGPMEFLLMHWQPGPLGILRMGAQHAIYCVGCCWVLMVILVTAGAMALHWVLALAVLVFIEKTLFRSLSFTRFIGGALIVLGLVVAARPEVAVALSRSPIPL